jgi:hypothetical protein
MIFALRVSALFAVGSVCVVFAQSLLDFVTCSFGSLSNIRLQ